MSKKSDIYSYIFSMKGVLYIYIIQQRSVSRNACFQREPVFFLITYSLIKAAFQAEAYQVSLEE